MVMPHILCPIEPHSLYPDRIQLTHHLHAPLSATSLDEALRTFGFYRTQSGRILKCDRRSLALRFQGLPSHVRRFLKPTSQLRVPLYEISVAKRFDLAKPITIRSAFNPLRIIGGAVRTRGDEISTVANASNWLPPQLHHADMTYVSSFSDTIARAIDLDLAALFSDVFELAHLSRAVTFQNVSVTELEVAYDVSTNNPRQLVHQRAHVFTREINNTIYSLYGNSASLNIGPDPAWMISGYLAAEERYKAYVKTNKRVRLECQMEYRVLKEVVKVQRRIFHQGRNFSDVFSVCAAHVAPVFDLILRDGGAAPKLDSSHTPVDVVSRLATSFRNPEKLREFLDILLRTGRIKNSFDEQAIRRLKRPPHPFLIPCSKARGYSKVAIPYSRAVWQLEACQRAFSEASRRRRPKPFTGIRHETTAEPRS